MSKTIDTTGYEFSHGRKPRGYGFWGFARVGHPGEEFWTTGTYTEAKRALPAGDWQVLP
jgi:hypothetical protein